MRAGEEEEESVLPTASDEGQAEPWDSSLWCCSGDRLSLLLSSSNAYESSCLGNLPWFTAGDRQVEGVRQHMLFIRTTANKEQFCVCVYVCVPLGALPYTSVTLP